MRKLFRIIVAIPCWLFLQTIGTMAFTFFFIAPILGFGSAIGNCILYLGTGNKEHLSESKEGLFMVMTLFGGSFVTYSWIQTGNFDLDNFGMTHLEEN